MNNPLVRYWRRLLIRWRFRSINWRRIPDIILFIMARSDAVIGWAIIMYRNTEDESWRQFACWLMEYAYLGSGTNWNKSDLVL